MFSDKQADLLPLKETVTQQQSYACLQQELFCSHDNFCKAQNEIRVDWWCPTWYNFLHI